MSPARHAAGALLAGLLLPLAAGPAQEPPPERVFAGSIDVRALEVYFDDSVLPQLESIGRRADRDFLVLEDGVALEPMAIAGAPAPRGPEADAAEQAPDGIELRLAEAVLWFDPALAAAGARAAAARAFAAAAPAFAEVERLEVVELDAGRAVGRRFATPVELAAHLYRRARAWDREPPAAPAFEQRLRALDRLALGLEGRTPGAGRRALWLAVDAWPVDAALLDELASGPPAASRRARLDEVGRLLAGRGWVTFALAAKPLPEPRDTDRSQRALEHDLPFADAPPRFILFRFPFRKRFPPPRVAVALDVATDLGLRPLAHLVRPTSGALAGEAGAVAGLLDRLAGRRLLVVRSPARPPGVLRPLEVRWTGGDGRTLPALGWTGTGVARELTRARLRALAAGDLDPRDGGFLRAGPDRVCLVSSAPRGWLRVSVAGTAAGATVVAHGAETAVERTRDGLCAAPASPPPGSRPNLVLVEELESGAWAVEVAAAAETAPGAPR